MGPRRLTSDALAGLSVAVVAVPQAVAYARVAGVPPVHALYAAAVPPLVAAAFASSPYLQTGPSAITCLLTFGALSTQAPPGSERYVALGLTLALVVGLVRLALGLLRAGVIAYLMSQPMLLGFVPAAALLIGASQVPAALGASAADGGPLEQAVWAGSHLGAWSAGSIVIAIAGLAIVLGGRRLHPLFPGVLVAAALGIFATVALGYGGTTVHHIPARLPPLSVDLPWSEVPHLLASGVVIALVGFSEAASVARRFAARERIAWDSSRELVSQGAANVAAAFTGGIPCGGSLSRSSVGHAAGARTRLSGAVTGLAVLAMLPCAAILEPLPTAVLAAIVIAAVLPLVRLTPLFALWGFSRPQFVVGATTFVLTLVLSPRIDQGVLIGVGLSVAVFLWRMLKLDVDARVEGEWLSVAPRGELWFATAQKLNDRLVGALAADHEIRGVRLDLGGVGRVDTTAAVAIRQIIDEVRRVGLEVRLVNVPPQSAGLTEGLLEAERNPLL